MLDLGVQGILQFTRGNVGVIDWLIMLALIGLCLPLPYTVKICRGAWPGHAPSGQKLRIFRYFDSIITVCWLYLYGVDTCLLPFQ